MNRDDLAKDFIMQFDEINEQTELPEFLEGYRILSCTYDRTGKSCYLVEDRDTDIKYLLKVRACSNGRNVLEIEHQRISDLAQVFPEEYKPSKYWKQDETEYLLKFYIQGMDLEKYQDKHRVLSIQDILRITIETCKETARLHALSPPVLHRDIKPKNLIIDYQGQVHLIDFETSRNYKKNKSKDTIFFGTEGNAAPEQYGYSQTDVRTDVYGIGKVLEFLYDENAGCQPEESVVFRRLKKIIQKAIAFDPAHRYPSVSALQCALEKMMKKVDVKQRIKRLRWIGILEVVAAVFLVFAVFFMKGQFHRQMETGDQVADKPRDAIEKPLTAEDLRGKTEETEREENRQLLEGGMKEALAGMLGKEELAKEDYDQITKVIVIGNQIYGMDTDLQSMEEELCQHQSDRYRVKGEIDDISELAKMNNLREVLLYDQRITDITPLAGLPIEGLYLSGNQIEDFSAVETMEQLEVLCLADNPVSVLPDLSKCRKLTTVTLGGNVYENINFLENSTVGNLYIENIYVNNNDFSVLSRLPNLYFLYSSNNQYGFYEELPKLSRLKGLALWEYIRNDLSVVESLPQLETLIVTGDIVKNMKGVEEASNLSHLAIDWTAITDISLVKELHRLTYIKINGLAIEDYSPLFVCDSLRSVGADAVQQEKIDAIDSNHIFQLVDD